LPESRLGRSLEKVIVSKIRRKAEQPEYRDWSLRQIAQKEGVTFTLGSVGRTFVEAFGRERVERARAKLDGNPRGEEASQRLFDLIAAETRATAPKA
jgi:hypothetical protein